MPTTPDRPAESILGPITPISCTEPGCHWACHGVPDKYADSRARIVREHVAAEHMPTPESPDRPADQLHAAAERRTTWPTAAPLQQAADLRRAAGDPLLADWLDATANALAWLAPYRDNEPGYGMWEAALAVARQLLGTTSEDGCCPVMTPGGRCEKDADHRAGRWPDDPHVPAASPVPERIGDVQAELLAALTTGLAPDTARQNLVARYRAAVTAAGTQPATASRAALTEIERQLLGFALELAEREIHARSLEIPDKDRAALASLRRLAGEAAAGAHHPTTTDPLADCATEYRVPVPEHGGVELLVRRQALAHGAGWAVSTRARGGGRAWTTEGWQDSISALSVDRLFCWPDPATAVDAARRALATPAVPAAPEETR
ncbi:hypothetical protein [Streptomyces sp. NPDC006863]|uniref:hypothetical protein n=1 Tax=Streptomyces sp. NPDC006863 TaxID=3154779 RepID=UPI0033C4B0C1